MVQMMDSGMTMAKLNLSHDSLKDNLRLISNYRNARRLCPHKNCAFMVEIRCREIRISHNLEKGKFIKLRWLLRAKEKQPKLRNKDGLKKRLPLTKL